MSAPRRLLLVAAPATARDRVAPVRRFRLGRVLMGVEELLGDQTLALDLVDAAGRPPAPASARRSRGQAGPARRDPTL